MSEAYLAAHSMFFRNIGGQNWKRLVDLGVALNVSQGNRREFPQLDHGSVSATFATAMVAGSATVADRSSAPDMTILRTGHLRRMSGSFTDGCRDHSGAKLPLRSVGFKDVVPAGLRGPISPAHDNSTSEEAGLTALAPVYLRRALIWVVVARRRNLGYCSLESRREVQNTPVLPRQFRRVLWLAHLRLKEVHYNGNDEGEQGERARIFTRDPHGGLRLGGRVQRDTAPPEGPPDYSFGQVVRQTGEQLKRLST
jgi:hypothetical protein